ncbi:hypothetical protein LTR85_001392 [Meristemomyces frigidus]|nr:hypothetical protein LTR85_001392 [Meristemomyces frigidus]
MLTVSLMLSLMSVYFTLVQQRELSLPTSADTSRKWLWNGTLRNTRTERSASELEAGQIQVPKQIRESFLTSNILLQAPFELLGIAISLFLGALAAYLGLARLERVKLGTVEVVEAELSNVASLSTIVPRSFHPVNPYIKKVFPNTALIRQWWSTIFSDEIQDPSCKVLTAVDPDDGTTIGVLTLRLLGPNDRGSGFWTMYDLTEDHDKIAYRPMIAGMTEHRERTMLGKPHFLIEAFGVDDAHKGLQIGKKLLSRACQIADEAGYETFVQANASARNCYCKLGFVEQGKSVMPGEVEYVEYMLVRPCKT